MWKGRLTGPGFWLWLGPRCRGAGLGGLSLLFIAEFKTQLQEFTIKTQLQGAGGMEKWSKGQLLRSTKL